MSAMGPCSTWIPLHEGSGVTLQLMQQEPAFRNAPILRLFCFSHPIPNGTVGLFLAREEIII